MAQNNEILHLSSIRHCFVSKCIYCKKSAFIPYSHHTRQSVSNLNSSYSPPLISTGSPRLRSKEIRPRSRLTFRPLGKLSSSSSSEESLFFGIIFRWILSFLILFVFYKVYTCRFKSF